MKPTGPTTKDRFTSSWLMLSYLAIAIGAPVMAIVLAIMASPQSHARASNAAAEVNALNGEKPALEAADRRRMARRESPPDSAMEGTKGTIFVRGSLNGSVRPPVDEPWQRWLR